MKKINIKILYSLVIASASLSSSFSFADTFVMRIPLTDELSVSVWNDVSTIEGEWVNVDGYRTCDEWSPDESKVLLNEEYIQSRSCNQLQRQEVTATQEDSISGNTRTTTYTNEQYVIETETQDAVGEMTGWVFISSEFTEWTYTGETNYSDWLPSGYDQEEEYTQTRSLYTYKERYEQLFQEYNEDGTVREYGNPLLRSSYDEEVFERTISVSSDEWVYNDDYYNCGDWSNVTSGTYYKRQMTCYWNNTREWTHYHDGSVTYTWTEERIPSGTVYQYVQTYSCPNTSVRAFRSAWSGCSKR